MRPPLPLVLLVLSIARAASAQEPPGDTPAAVEAGAEERESGEWSASAAVNIYLVPDTRTYAQPTLAADRGHLHLEARYNYEALETASAWIGFNLGLGDALRLDFTPMVGGVFGDSNGIAPGYELTLAWWKLELYSEGEYLFDTGDSSGNFAYAWSEVSYSPWEWVRLGMVAQRTRAYETDVDIQRGPLLGFSYRWLSAIAYVFDIGQSSQTFVVGLGASF